MWGPVLGLAALLTLGGSPARAGIGIEFVSAVPDSGNFLYTYTATLLSNSQLNTTGGGVNNSAPFNFFTIYDFNGYIAGSAAAGTTLLLPTSGSWSIVEGNLGRNAVVPSGPPPPGDSASIPNITYNYVGVPVTAVTGTTVPLGTFTLRSTHNVAPNAEIFFVGATQKASSPGDIANNISELRGPSPSGIPEPGSLVLTACTVLGFGAYTRVRRRRSQA